MDPFIGLPAILGGAGQIFGGIIGAQNAKAEAMANQIQTRWNNFQSQWQTNEANYNKVLQYGAQQRQRKDLEEGSLKNQLAQERDLIRQVNQQTSLLARGHKQAAASLNASAETRGLSTDRGSGALIKNALTMNAWADLDALKQNVARSQTSIREQRKQALGSLGPLQIPMPAVYFPGTMPMIPNTMGMIVGSALAGAGSIAGGLGQRRWFTNNSGTTSGAPID